VLSLAKQVSDPAVRAAEPLAQLRWHISSAP
jgi:hypothetical protein